MSMYSTKNDGNIYKICRKEKNYSQQDVAKILNIDRSTVSKWESGVAIPDQSILPRIADLYNVSVDFLLGRDIAPQDKNYDFFRYDNIEPIQLQKIRMLGDIACGTPIYADEDRESYVLSGTELKADFCLRAKGDSMIGARIMDGDIVFCRAQEMVENGEIGVVIIGDEATLKRVYFYPDQKKLVLQAENSKYEPFVYVGEELNGIRILGKAIAFQSDIR